MKELHKRKNNANDGRDANGYADSGRLLAIEDTQTNQEKGPGGKVVIADFRGTQPYVQRLQELGMIEVTHRTLDWRFWYGGPWGSTKLVSARKPA